MPEIKSIEEFRKKLYEFIPKKYFVDNLDENRIGVIKIALLRKTINPFIDRSTDSEETITFKMDDKREVIEVPARKFKSKEKLLGLKISREFGVVDVSVRYNMIDDKSHLSNPNSIVFGDSVTKAGAAESVGLPSRAIYDWGYSIRDFEEITQKLQHNALSEEGTMYEGKTGELRQSLFRTRYVLPNTFIPFFISVDNLTPELFVHLLFTIMYEKRYGAQTTTDGANFNNDIIAIGFGDFEQPINSFIISKEWDFDIGVTEQAVKNAISLKMSALYPESLINDSDEDKKITGLITFINQTWTNKELLKELYKKASEDIKIYLQQMKILSK
ncbi:CRISPR-associated protein Csc2 [Candidatus Methanoperedens nitroreducens]|uniref:CRISPR-associated protein Csc2 n=1 Tax=Candidatus Methanoperedens nitratireducens TaxID=1392998 RepID=A0A062V365_9EURY|nr:type I-D CRISPR-associated protein Cas7/Csc2 [Candidatus Methanoperedens nitroreducens]KCZ73506.1 CRISPR-associated protein Csc2 [Candidatus Methanoperedens nitroreducens]MDJ1422538.1 type I-D CRISPR-associated protein Cas7/Csc2 [Candidatus Methanoperedens sp.]